MRAAAPESLISERHTQAADANGGTAIGLGVLAFAVAATLAALLYGRPPRPLPEDAPSTEFSARRAMRHLAIIAVWPHPTGSDEIAHVRQYLIAQLADLDLHPQIQKTTVFSSQLSARFGQIRGATVQNVLARLPGTDSGKALMLSAHYDSVPTGPGASDDGSGVATILETVRALKQGPRLKNDLIILLTDGEEVGFNGADAFVEQHPWAKDVGLVVNFDSRGTRGPSIMFETSDGNGALIREFAKAAPYPVGSFLTQAVYKVMFPPSSDFTVFKAAGMEGVNFANIEGSTWYHTRNDDLDHLDPATLQHDGSYALSLARHFGMLKLPIAKEEDAVYFDTPILGFIHYSRSTSIALTVGTIMLFAGVTWLGLSMGRVKVSGLIVGIAGFLVAALTAAVVSSIVLIALGAVENIRLRGFGGGISAILFALSYRDAVFEWSFAALTIAVMATLYRRYSRGRSYGDLALGALLLCVLLMALNPGGAGSLHQIIPGLLALAVVFWIDEPDCSPRGAVIFCAGALIPLTTVPSATHSLFSVGSLGLAPVASLLEVLTLGFAIPIVMLVARTLGRRFVIGALLVGLALAAYGVTTARYDSAHPALDHLRYVLNADAGKALWASSDRKPDEWTAHQLGRNPTTGELADATSVFPGTFLQADAPFISIAPPTLEVKSDSTQNGVRRLALNMRSQRHALALGFYLRRGEKPTNLTINRQDAPQGDTEHLSPMMKNALRGLRMLLDRYGFLYFAPPDEGLSVVLELRSPGDAHVTLADRTDELPGGLGVAPRPDYLEPSQMLDIGDGTVVVKSYDLTRR